MVDQNSWTRYKIGKKIKNKNFRKKKKKQWIEYKKKKKYKRKEKEICRGKWNLPRE